MFYYLPFFSLLIFTAVISAVVGFLFHDLTTKLLRSNVSRFIAGAGVSMLVGGFITKLLRFDNWYYYLATISLTFVLYVISIRSLTKSNE